jgi:histone acetyltransferase 1
VRNCCLNERGELKFTDVFVAAFEKSSTFDAAVADASYATWTPPGELWKTIQSGDHTYEVWKGSLADMAVQQMLKRIQILVPFFIEGGTFIELQDPEWSLERWTVFFLYEKKTVDLQPESSPYCFMGYSTVYRYFYFQPLMPDTRPSKKQRISHPANLDFELPFQETYKFSSLPARSRISQFIILPPFQGGGNGSRFYNAIFDFYLAEPQTIEITVEDPNEAFDDLRDLNDLTRLRMLPEFLSIRINPDAAPRPKGPVPRDIVNIDLLETIRSKTKIAPRQFYRVVEMHLLSMIPKSVRQCLLLEQERKKGKDPVSIAKEHEYHLWTLWVKKRLYKHNKDMLMQLDRVERIEKMEQVVSGVEGDYARLLGILDDRTKAKETVETGASSNGNANGKRRNPDDDADEEEADEPAAKKAKLAT